MADFVLVHGAWQGAWCWKRVLPALWAAGHRAFAVTLSGVGERAHARHGDIRLRDHVDDVAGVIEAEELNDFVLVGHSYGGMVATGVADRFAHRIAHLVYLDAVVPKSGESWSSGHPEEVRTQRRRTIAETGVIPPADPSLFGLAGEDAAWVLRRQTPQPGGVYEDPLHFDEARLGRLRRSFISCTNPALKTIDAMRARVSGQPGWQWHEIATGHAAMISAPQALTGVLLGAV